MFNSCKQSLGRDHNTFLQFKIKGSGMMKDKTMGVNKIIVQAYNQSEDDILNHKKYISDVIILATLYTPMTLARLPIQKKSPMQWSATNQFPTWGSGVWRSLGHDPSSSSLRWQALQWCSVAVPFFLGKGARQNMFTIVSALLHMVFLGGMSWLFTHMCMVCVCTRLATHTSCWPVINVCRTRSLLLCLIFACGSAFNGQVWQKKKR